MTVWVWILDHPWVLDPTDTGSGSFLHLWVEPAPDPHITRFECRFHFSPTDALETRKTPEKHETRKKSKTQKNSWKEKNPKQKNPDRNSKKLRKKHIYKTRRAPELNPKPDGFGFECQISPVGTCSGAKFNPTTFFHESGFR
jgi:hypothetical protein